MEVTDISIYSNISLNSLDSDSESDNNRNLIKEFKNLVENKEYLKLEEYLKYNSLKNIKTENSNFDFLIYSIEHDIPTHIIKNIIDKSHYEINNNKTPLYISLKKENFEIANLLLKNGAELTFNIDIINNIKQEIFTVKHLKFLLSKGLPVDKITPQLLIYLIENNKNKLLEIIFNHFKFNNPFILSLLEFYNNKTPLSRKKFNQIISEEKEKIEIPDDMYKAAIKKNKESLRILFENESGNENKIKNHIFTYDILSNALGSRNLKYIEKVLDYDIIQSHFKDYDKIFSFAISRDSCHPKLAKFLIKYFLKKINDENSESFPKYINLLLNFMIKNKNLDLVKYIMENDLFKKGININSEDTKGEYPIFVSIENDDIEIFKYLLNHHADPNTKNINGISLSHLLMFRQKESFLDHLFSYKFNINEKDGNGISLLVKAVNNNNHKLVSQIIDYADSHNIDIDINEKINDNFMIFLALLRNNFPMVKKLVDYGLNHKVDLHILDRNGHTPIVLSYIQNCKEIFNYLISRLDINQKDSNGKNILHYVLEKNDIQTTKLILDNYNINIFDKDSNGDSPLSIAINQNNTEIVKRLIEYTKKNKTIINIIEKDLLAKAIYNNNTEMAKILLDYANDNYINNSKEFADGFNDEYDGKSLLGMAIDKNNDKIVDSLIEFAEDNRIPIKIYGETNKNDEIDDNDINNKNLLIESIKKNNYNIIIAIVNYCVKNHIDINFFYNNDYTLLIYTYLEKKEIFKYLLKYLNINQKDRNEMTILFYAIKNKDIKLVKYLIDNEADVNLTDKYGTSIIDYALESGNYDILLLLLNRTNLKFEKYYHEDQSPIDYLFKSKSKYTIDQKNEIITKLIEKGFNINSTAGTDSKKDSLLTYALKNSCRPLAEYLIKNGINVNIKNDDGKTALDYVLENLNEDIIKRFIKYEDKPKIPFETMKIYLKDDKLKILKLLIENFFNINTQNEKDGNTLLHEAVKNQDYKVVKLLVRKGAKISIKNNSKLTAIDLNKGNTVNENSKSNKKIEKILNRYRYVKEY